MRNTAKANFYIQVDESANYIRTILLVYVRFIYEDDLREKMSFIKCLPETINGDDIFHEVLQYFNDKDIPLTNLINTASDGSAAVTEKVKGFNSRINLFPHKSFMPIALSTDSISLQRILEEACKKYSTLPYVQLSSSN